MSAKAVYIHVGLPKTGTTYIQASVWEARDPLASTGCLVAGKSPQSSWQAASDLLGRRPQGAEAPQVAGSWDAFVSDVAAWTGSKVVFSEELLVTANRRQVKRAVRSLSPAEVHVVVTVRDLARVLPSLWQQELKKGRAWTWEEFIAAVRDPEVGPASAATSFWLRFDLPRVLRPWAEVIPAANIHVVTVPPSGADRGILLNRFARAVDVPTALLEAPTRPLRTNIGLGATEAEALRRLNVGLADTLNERQYTRVVVDAVIPALQRRSLSSPRVRIPAEHRGWVVDQSAELVEFLTAGPYDLIGEVEDLAVTAQDPSPDPADGVDERDLVAPLTDALVAACLRYGRFWWSVRKQGPEVAGDTTVPLGSRARAVVYRTKRHVLDNADRSVVLGRLVRTYLKRTGS